MFSPLSRAAGRLFIEEFGEPGTPIAHDNPIYLPGQAP
jgi:hypothetical protein